jgi:FtsZ-interacting cell division protein ZipA
MAAPARPSRWKAYVGPPESNSQPKIPSQQPPDRYESPPWNSHPSDEETDAEEEREAAALAAWEVEEAEAEAEEEEEQAVEMPSQAARQPAKPKRKTGPKPKPKPLPKKVRITEEEHLTLLHLCNFHAKAYRRTDKSTF